MADVTIHDCGSIVQFELHTEAAKTWFAENVQAEGWQWFGNDRLNVDHRYAGHLAEGIIDAGLEVDA
jgi:hypothetical protein